MKQSPSTTRRGYEGVYSDIRRYGGLPYEQMPFGKQDEIADCALLSYDYRDSHFDGWINRQRMDIFRTKALYRPEWDGLPF